MVRCQRDAFSLPRDLHYLNCAYMSPLSRRVQAAGIEAIHRKAVPSRIDSELFFSESNRARALFATLLNVADPQRVAIIPSASYGVATVARNTPLSPGSRIIVAHEQFPSNVYAWRRLCRERGAELVTVAPPDRQIEGRARLWNERVLEAIDRRTALVALEHVHWTDGTRFDLEAIGGRAREHGAALVVDGTQSIGAMPFDLRRIQPDAVICAAYKWLMGPYSIGFAYYGPRYDGGAPLEDNWIAREGSEDFRGLVEYRDEYQPGVLRYDAGERSNLILMPMAITALEQLLEWTPDGVQAYCRALTAELIARAQTAGFTVADERERGAHLFGLRAPDGLDISHIAAELRARQVFVSLRGSAVRVAPHVYNDEDDVGELADVLCALTSRARR